MDLLLLTIFGVVYLGMMLGRFPGLALDRTGVALLGAISMVVSERLTPQRAWQHIDVPTMGLLFGLMVVSAQFRLGGCYTRFTRRLAELDVGPGWLLGLVTLAAAGLTFLFAPWPREVLALGAAGLLLTSRRTASRALLHCVDWHLLMLFAGLFVVNGAVADSGYTQRGVEWLVARGLDPGRPAVLFGLSAVLSNLVSNVPATMLLLPSATDPLAGPLLALSSTFAGNLLVVGSVANMIVMDQAAQLGVRIDWRTHARTGIPVTLISLVIAAVWLALLALWVA